MTEPTQLVLGGGTAILVKRFLPHYHVPTPPLLTCAEATFVALTAIDQEPFLVDSIYIPPYPKVKTLGDELDTILKTFRIAILVGDFNAKYTSWGCSFCDPRVVIPILKPGKDPTAPDSYRPIALLPVLCKLAEKIMLARLNDHLENENILVPEQHGFRPRLSTTHQLLRVVEFIKEGNNRDQCTAAVFLDIQKAFDRVWHTGLLFKLIT
ncbi:RNA-directed DNA polymerase from mobile element jockey [Trichonephila clavata]|uniref:RNA-directed DNA polymerase from mobile element jockey n=1 Tax=Trichonephila clavata TaxID=2740835 RepID=A0A8X6L634_TRICU|nr:RNA-directed DNA polymerase from mobile element jockey [Trichonephila clavata]